MTYRWQSSSSPASVFSNFENWKSGTNGWVFQGQMLNSPVPGSHFNSFNYSTSNGELTLNKGDIAVFNTSALPQPTLTLNGTQIANGTISLTSHLTEVAVFNFVTIAIGEGVSLSVVGERAISVLSRSSIRLNSTFTIPPGKVGGFLGAKKGEINNANGPGSGALRVYLHTIRTSGQHVKEVQTITTSAKYGQTLGGYFRVLYKGQQSDAIPHDASAVLMKQKLENSLKRMGVISVGRNHLRVNQGYTWTITFETAIGNVPQLLTVNELTGLEAGVTSNTTTHGNSIGGNFSMSFLGQNITDIPYNAAASFLENKISDITKVKWVRVTRNDPGATYDGEYHMGTCEHGLCANGPGPAGGLWWSITTMTDEGLVSPLFPTSSAVNTSGPVSPMNVSSHLTGNSAKITIATNHDGNYFRDSFATLIPKVSSPFTLAFGGSGGSHAGLGGVGHGYNSPGPVILQNNELNDLSGGSGGAAGGRLAIDIIRFSNSGIEIGGKGGPGAGAMELVAVNDIYVGPHGGITCNAGSGGASWNAGGGGAGGTINIAAGGSFESYGTFQAHGGNGGAGVPQSAQSSLAGSGGGGSGGGIFVQAQSIFNSGSFSVTGGNAGACPSASSCQSGGKGSDGIIRQETKLGVDFMLDTQTGAQGTQQSLLLRGGERRKTRSNVMREAPMPRNGPAFYLGENKQPTRVTMYMKIGDYTQGSTRNNQGSYFALHEANNPTESMIGVGLVDGSFAHGANFPHLHSKFYTKENVLMKHAIKGKWHKMDLTINWQNPKTYTIKINDMRTKATNVPFASSTGYVKTIGLYNYDALHVWFDEIYVGRDDSMNFDCPLIKHSAGTTTGVIEHQGPVRKGWSNDFFGDADATHAMQLHTSHLSEREYYQDATISGMQSLDGAPHQKYINEATTQTTNFKQGMPEAGSLLYVPDDPSGENVGRKFRTGMSTTAHGANTADAKASWFAPYSTSKGNTGTYYWFSEHNAPYASLNTAHSLQGGVFACSSRDLVHWKNEGTMLHYSSINTTVGGGPGVSYIVERPKVIYNNLTKKYVMWMHVDNAANTAGLAGVATSDFPNGPFSLKSVFKPDGNRTQEQTVVQDEDGSAYLIRTYYATVEYILPKAIMQPMWSSVYIQKNGQSIVDFSLNYHRAFYNKSFDSSKWLYDDPNDICVQRLRKEDETLEIIRPEDDCRDQPEYDPPITEPLQKGLVEGVRPSTIHPDKYSNPKCKKKHEGQGYPQILSRFKYPEVADNNEWYPSSVPAVKAQTWRENYIDGNIADNPVHNTEADKLIGEYHVVEKRHSKYVAISKLTDDYLNTTGQLYVIEGELDDHQDLLALIGRKNGSNLFGWKSGDRYATTEPVAVWGSNFDQEKWAERPMGSVERDQLQSYLSRVGTSPDTATYASGKTGTSYHPQDKWIELAALKPMKLNWEYDWETRYWQYLSSKHDRNALPVNFADQVRLGTTALNFSEISTQNRSHEVVRKLLGGELDRNCFVKGDKVRDYFGYDDLTLELFNTSKSWNALEAGGGSMGSSADYDYTNNVNYVDPRWTPNSQYNYHYARTEAEISASSRAKAREVIQYYEAKYQEKQAARKAVEDINQNAAEPVLEGILS
eukprot:g178.t1